MTVTTAGKDGAFAYNFTGNFVWVRAVINYTDGTIKPIMLIIKENYASFYQHYTRKRIYTRAHRRCPMAQCSWLVRKRNTLHYIPKMLMAIKC